MRRIRKRRKRRVEQDNVYRGEPKEPYPAGYLERNAARFEQLDTLPEWQVQLVWEYGYAATMRALRTNPTPARAKAALEQDRQLRQFMPLPR